jgi:cysteine desulfurase
MPIYLDYHATTPCDPRVIEELLPWLGTNFGNASSRQHAYGRQAAAAVQIAREQVAALIHASPEEIIFTSGATESINLALKGAAYLYHSKGRHIITAQSEHSAVLDTCRRLEKQGYELTYLPVDAFGLISLEALEQAIKPHTILIAVMVANNETGVIQPVHEISRIARSRNILFISDATQAAGKIPIDIEEDGIDLLACSAHKLYGPKGIGALYIRRRNPRVRLEPLLDGGGHEKGLRSGTLNVPGIVGFGKAAELAAVEIKSESERIRQLRDRLESALLQLDKIARNGHKTSRLPTVTNLSFGYTEAQALQSALNRELAVSAGSACAAGSTEPSHVLRAMGLGENLARSSVRFSLGRFSTDKEIDFTIWYTRQCLDATRSQSQVWLSHQSGKLPESASWDHPAGIQGLLF